MATVEERSIVHFGSNLKRLGVSRVSLTWDAASQGMRASHYALQPLANRIAADPRDFDAHEAVFLAYDHDLDVMFVAAIHRTIRGQGAGGVRCWRYDRAIDAIIDGLRLSRGMTRKNALAGLWWGGGKGLIAYSDGVDVQEPGRRREIYAAYGRFITSLRGCYVTAEDVGTSVDDMEAVFSATRFTTCVPPRLGGSGNPSIATARGTVRGMEAALAHLDKGGLEDKTVAVQGLGHVATPMLMELQEKGVARAIGTDIDAATVDEGKARFGDWLDARIVDRGDNAVLAEDVDIVAPCAVGGVLNKETIDTIVAPIVCGAANNQLADPLTDDRRLQRRGALFMPDFLVNRMGIVNCADEQYGYATGDSKLEKHLGTDWDGSIYNLSLRILAEAAESGATPAGIARRIADERSAEAHPVWGHRGAEIIASLVRDGWADATD